MRLALWRIFQHELLAAGEGERMLGIAQVIASGRLVEGRTVHVDASNALELDAMALDHGNAGVYWKLRGYTELSRAAAMRVHDLARDLAANDDPQRDQFLRKNILLAVAGTIDAFINQATARPAVLRVLQDAERDRSKRKRVLGEAEHDAKDAEQFRAAIRELVAVHVPGAGLTE